MMVIRETVRDVTHRLFPIERLATASPDQRILPGRISASLSTAFAYSGSDGLPPPFPRARQKGTQF